MGQKQTNLRKPGKSTRRSGNSHLTASNVRPQRRHRRQNPIANELEAKHFTNIEFYSLRTTYENLTSDTNDGIQEEEFLQYVGFPDEISIGPLLYRSFTYLATYPKLHHNNRPLTLDGLTIALAVYCDKIKDVIHEDRTKLIFDSFAVIPYEELSGNHSDSSSSTEESTPSLNDDPLKIKVHDDFLKVIGMDNEQDSSIGTEHSARMLCKDVLNLLTGMVWFVVAEMSPVPEKPSDVRAFLAKQVSPEHINHLKNMVKPFVEHMARYDPAQRSEHKIKMSEHIITWPTFHTFVSRNTPNMFRSFSPFFYSQFLIGTTLSQQRAESLFFGPHVQYWPHVESNIVTDPVNMALLSWALPQEAVARRRWDRLFAGSEHGFSMNRFHSHVFKYPGPTLLLISAEIIPSRPLSRDNSNAALNKMSAVSASKQSSSSLPKTLLLAAYVADPWRTTPVKTSFGSPRCAIHEIHPNYEKFPATSRNTDYVFFNSSIGIGFGGLPTSSRISNKVESQEANTFFLQVDNTLQYGRYRNDPHREIMPSYNLSETRTFFDVAFEVVDVEVFGLGGDMAREKQKSEWKWEANETDKRKNIHVRNESGDIDRELLKMVGIIDESSSKEVVEKHQ